MIFRALDVSGDWIFGKGKSNYLSGTAAVAEDIRTRLGCFLNDCFFDANAGVDWFNLLGTNNKAAIIYSVRAVILNTEHVTRIISFTETTDANRNLTLFYTVETDLGPGQITGIFEVPASEFVGISKFLKNIFFDGSFTFTDVDVSSQIHDAQSAVWILYDIDNGYTVVVGAVQPLNATTVRITISPAPTGYFRLVGIE